MTETDLVTAGDSTENDKLSNPVTPDTSADSDASGSATEANTSASDGSLATMVLPELRALANRAGVKGTSGMRKNELIAAIRESRQSHANGAPSNGGAGGESEDDHSAKAAANHAEATVDDATHAESSERGSSGDHAGEQNHRNDKKQQNENDKPSRDRGQQDSQVRRVPRLLTRIPTVAATDRARADSRTAAARTSKTTTVTGAAAAEGAASGSAGVAATGRATAAVVTPNCAKTTSFSR